jgi:hypothetical protein
MSDGREANRRTIADRVDGDWVGVLMYARLLGGDCVISHAQSRLGCVHLPVYRWLSGRGRFGDVARWSRDLAREKESLAAHGSLVTGHRPLASVPKTRGRARHVVEILNTER